MPYTIASEHFEFYLRHGFIELEQVISNETADFLKEAFFNSLEKKNPKFKTLPLNAQDAFIEGHDLVRKDAALQKKLFTRNLVDTFSNLFDIAKPRLAFDQMLYSDQASSQKPVISDLGFQEKSCVAKLRGVILIALTDITLHENPLSCLPVKKANATFFKPHFRLSLEPFIQKGNGLMLMIGIGDDKLLYKHIVDDPFVHTLKKEGYVFGDLLKNATHPGLKGS